MFNNFFGSKKKEEKSDFEIVDDDDDADESYVENLKLNLSRMIVYADSADIKLQREVAEKLANEAVKPSRQVQIVEYGGLKLLVPLTNSNDVEVQRLAAHALANLSVNATNQEIMASEGAIEMLIKLVSSTNELIQRQSAKALANLGVNSDNKRKIALKGGIPKLVALAQSPLISIKIEAIAALANLAVNDENELEIVESGGLVPIVDMAAEVAKYFSTGGGFVELKGTHQATSPEHYEELGAQCARALRNLSVHPSNKAQVVSFGAAESLLMLASSSNDRVSQQARRALKNLEGAVNDSKDSKATHK